MAGVIILKGHGVFTTPAIQALMGEGARRALSPGEVEEQHGRGISPFHINPHTGKKWGEAGEGEFVIKDQFNAMVDEWTREIKKHNPNVDEDATRRRLREILNQSTKNFNSYKQLDGYHRYPEEGVFLDVDDPSSVNPKLVTNTRFPMYQKHAMTFDGSWREEAGQHAPERLRIRNQDGTYPDWTASNTMHNDHGHLSEAKYFGAHNIFDRLVRQDMGDPNSPLHLPNSDTSKVMPVKLAGGVTEPSALVYMKNEDGSLTPAYRRRMRNQPSNLGRQTGAALHGSHEFLSSLLTLHPSFFEPIKGAQDRNGGRERLARIMLGEDADEELIRSMAQTPALAIINRHFPWKNAEGGESGTGKILTSNSRTGHGTSTMNLYRSMLKALSIPNSEFADMPEDAKDRFRFFHHNANNIGVSRNLGPVQLGSHTESDMRQMLMASILMERDERANTAYGDSRGSRSRTGAYFREMLRRKHNVQPLNTSAFKWVPAQEVRAMQATPKAPYTPAVPFPEDAGTNAGQRLGHAGIGLLNPTAPDDEDLKSVDTIFDVMEDLQSADARMDSLIMKSLPAHRRFALSDSYDVSSLCRTFSLDERDLHYIDQTMGDWGKIAQNLKVEASVVKAVKVALRW